MIIYCRKMLKLTKIFNRKFAAMEIQRNYYLDKLVSRKGNKLIKIVTGVRRCGKSYLLNTIFYRHLLESGVKKEHIIKFAFDSAEDLNLIGEDLIDLQLKKRKVDPKKFMKYVNSKIRDKKTYYLLLDEVQLLGAFETVLNGYLYKDNLDVFVTGSNAKFLSRDIVTEFAGRGDEIHMYPLNFSEFMSYYKGDKYDGLSQYMLYGGIPMVVLKKNEQDKIKTLQNLFSEIYISDIIKRHSVRNQDVLEDLLNILSSSVGSLTNPEKLKNTFQSVEKKTVSATTIKKYLDYFEDSFLLDSAIRYDVKGKFYIGTPVKYYFSDPGLRNVRINFRQFEPNHIMENIIFNELKMRGFNVDIGVVPVMGKNSKGKAARKQLEIDFICNHGSNKYYIQSAYYIPDAEKRNQETRPLAEIKDAFKKIIVTKDSITGYYDDMGIYTASIFNFLLDPSIIER